MATISPVWDFPKPCCEAFSSKNEARIVKETFEVKLTKLIRTSVRYLNNLFASFGLAYWKIIKNNSKNWTLIFYNSAQIVIYFSTTISRIRNVFIRLKFGREYREQVSNFRNTFYNFSLGLGRIKLNYLGFTYWNRLWFSKRNRKRSISPVRPTILP